MATNRDDRSPRAIWLPQFVSVLMERFGDRLGHVRPASALLAAERVAIDLNLDSVVRLLPLIRDGATNSRPVSLVLAYLESARRSGEFSIPPGLDRSVTERIAPDDAQIRFDEFVSVRSVASSDATTIPAPPPEIEVDTSPTALVESARKLASEGRSESALRLLSAAIAIDPFHEEAYLVSAAIADSIGRHEVASTLSRHVGAEVPETDVVSRELGRTSAVEFRLDSFRTFLSSRRARGN